MRADGKGDELLIGPAASAAPGQRLGSSQLLGRRHELEVLNSAVDATLRGKGRTVLIRGEAGVGKTALLREFYRSAARDIPVVATTECFELELTVAFAPLRALMRNPSFRSSGTENGPSRIQTLIAKGTLAVTTVERSQINIGFAELIDSLAVSDPVMIGIDDLHWADGASLELFGYLARKLSGRSVLLLGAFRPNDADSAGLLERIRLDLARRADAIDLSLGPLSVQDTAAMVRTSLKLDRSPDREFVDRLQLRTEGNPLLIEEVLHSLIDRGLIRLQDQAWYVTARRWDEVAPPSVAAAVASRAQSIADIPRAILQAAAVLGRAFTFEALVAVSRRSPEEVIEALRIGIEAQLLEEGPEGARGAYRFRHALIRDAVEATLLLPERASRHAAAARALSGSAPAAELAHHFEAAGDQVNAALQHAEAAREAMRLSSFPDAFRHAERVVELAPPKTIEGDFLIRMMPAAFQFIDPRRGLRFAERARDFYAHEDDAMRYGRMLAWVGAFQQVGGHLEQAREAQLEAIATLEPFGDSLHLTNALVNLSLVSPGPDEAFQLATRALQMADRVGTSRERARTRLTLGRKLLQAGQTAEGLARVREAAGIARRCDPAEIPSVGVFNLLWEISRALALASGLREERLQMRDEAIALAREHQFRAEAVIDAEDEAAFERGDWDECFRLGDELRSFWDGTVKAATLDLRDIWMRLLRQGPASETLLISAKAHDTLVTKGWPLAAAWWSSAIALSVGDHERAIAVAQPAHAHLDDERANAAGVYAIAAARLRGAWGEVARWTTTEDSANVPIVRGRGAFAAAEWALRDSDLRGGLERLRTSAECLREAGMSDGEHLVRLRRVEVLAASGQSDAAKDELTPLLAYWRMANAGWKLAGVRDSLAQHGLVVPTEREKLAGGPTRSRGRLTTRERQVATFVGQGLTNKEIGERLGLSARTVESHVERIREKFGFSSRSQIAAWIGRTTTSGESL